MLTRAKEEKQRKSKNGTKPIKLLLKRSPPPLPVTALVSSQRVNDLRILRLPQQPSSKRPAGRQKQMKLNFVRVRNTEECSNVSSDSLLQSVDCGELFCARYIILCSIIMFCCLLIYSQ